jgi:hypothetical protein
LERQIYFFGNRASSDRHIRVLTSRDYTSLYYGHSYIQKLHEVVLRPAARRTIPGWTIYRRLDQLQRLPAASELGLYEQEWPSSQGGRAVKIEREINFHLD